MVVRLKWRINPPSLFPNPVSVVFCSFTSSWHSSLLLRDGKDKKSSAEQSPAESEMVMMMLEEKQWGDSGSGGVSKEGEWEMSWRDTEPVVGGGSSGENQSLRSHREKTGAWSRTIINNLSVAHIWKHKLHLINQNTGEPATLWAAAEPNPHLSTR